MKEEKKELKISFKTAILLIIIIAIILVGVIWLATRNNIPEELCGTDGNTNIKFDFEDKKQDETLSKEKRIISFLEDNIGIEVFLDSSANEQDIINFGNELKQMDHIKKVEYVSKEDALEKMKDIFGEKATLLEHYEQDNPFPASYIIFCEINDINNTYYDKIYNKISEMELVDKVTSNASTWMSRYNEGTLESFMNEEQKED